MERKLGRSINITESNATRLVLECTEIGNPENQAKKDICIYVPLASIVMVIGFLILDALMILTRPAETIPLPVLLISLGIGCGSLILGTLIRYEPKRAHFLRYSFDLPRAQITIASGTKAKSGEPLPGPTRGLPLDDARVDIVEGKDLRKKAYLRYNTAFFKGMHVLVLFLPRVNTYKLLHYSPSLEEVTKLRDIIQEFLGRKNSFSCP